MAEIIYHVTERLDGKNEPTGFLTIETFGPDGALRTKDIVENPVVTSTTFGHVTVKGFKFPRDITCHNDETVQISSTMIVRE